MDPLIRIGEVIPKFRLTDLEGRATELTDLRGRIVVLYFWSAECEWCDRVDRELIRTLEHWNDQVQVLLIASNANEPCDLIERVRLERHLPTVLMDDQHRVADLYGAQTTPHFFIIGKTGKLGYQGAWDDISFKQRVATRLYVPEVIEALMHDQKLKVTQTPPYGCTLVRYKV